jgi:hypothetical protein
VISRAPLRIPKINSKFGIVVSDFKVCVTSHIATNSYTDDCGKNGVSYTTFKKFD